MDKPPFEPDKKPKKIAVAGKKGYGMSAAAHLAKMAMQKAAERKMAKEEIEHLDESVKVAKAAAVEAHKKGLSLSKADDHIFNAVNAAYKGKSEGAGGGITRARINNATDAGVAHFKKLMGMTEEKEMPTLRDILEGRGRPRKNPDDPKWQKKPAAKKSEDDDEEEDHGPARPESPHLHTEPDKHISVQLKVAHDMKDEKGGADVKFANGKTHFVKHDVAHKVLSALDKLKPADRAKVHDHIAQSHDNLMAVHKVL